MRQLQVASFRQSIYLLEDRLSKKKHKHKDFFNKNIKDLFETVNKELHYANKWFIANTLNAGKTKYLFFRYKKYNQKLHHVEYYDEQ